MIFPEHTYGCGTAALDNSILFPSGTFFGTQNGAFHGSVMNAGSFSLASIFCAPRVGYGWAHGCIGPSKSFVLFDPNIFHSFRARTPKLCRYFAPNGAFGGLFG